MKNVIVVINFTIAYLMNHFVRLTEKKKKYITITELNYNCRRLDNMKCYTEIMRTFESKINEICNANSFDNITYYDVYNKYKELKAYDIALDTTYCHNKLEIEYMLQNII